MTLPSHAVPSHAWPVSRAPSGDARPRDDSPERSPAPVDRLAAIPLSCAQCIPSTGAPRRRRSKRDDWNKAASRPQRGESRFESGRRLAKGVRATKDVSPYVMTAPGASAPHGRSVDPVRAPGKPGSSPGGRFPAIAGNPKRARCSFQRPPRPGARHKTAPLSARVPTPSQTASQASREPAPTHSPHEEVAG